MKYTIKNPSSLDPKQLRRKQGRIATRVFSNSFIGLVGYTLVSSFAVLAVSIIMGMVLDEATNEKIINSEYFAMGMQIVCMYVIALPAFLAFIRPIPTRRIIERDLKFSDFMRMFLISMFLMRLGSAMSQVVNYLLGVTTYAVESTPSSIIDSMISAPNILTVLVVVVIGPIAEELIFRKALIDRLGKYGEKMALVVSSVAFGIFHGNFDQVFYATMVGFVLGFLYIKTGRIRFSCILHMLVNFFGTVPAMFLDSYLDGVSVEEFFAGSTEADTTKLIVVLAIVGLLSLLTICGFIALCRASKSGVFKYKFRTDIELTPWRKLRCALLNIGVILFLVLCISSFITYYEILLI